MNEAPSLTTNTAKKIDVRKITLMAILSALAAIVMLFKFPLWFAPGFYKIDLSDIIVLIGTFALGPIEGIIMQFLKVAINTLFEGTTTVFVGEAANFILGCFFVVPAGIIYRKYKRKKGAVIGLIIGTLSLTIFASLINYFILLPAYSYFYGAPIEAFIGQGAEKNSSIKGLFTFIIFATAPFNLVKGILDSVVTLCIYKYISPLIKGKNTEK